MRSTRRWKSAPNHPWQRPSAVPRPWTPHNNLLHIKASFCVVGVVLLFIEVPLLRWLYERSTSLRSKAVHPIFLMCCLSATDQPMRATYLALC